MEWLRTSSIALCLMLLPIGMAAQTNDEALAIADSLADLQSNQDDGKQRPTKYIPTQEDMKQTFFQGFTVSADVLNMGLYFLSSYGTLEAALRINLLNTYFPIAELGLGRCDKTDYNTKVAFSTTAPYLRVGLDYNLLKDKWQTNKLFVGLRYGITNFDYAISGPPQTDPIWKDSKDFTMDNINATSHFAEVVFGCQVKVWSFIHMGWSVRYKMEIATSKSRYAHPYYIPGYGTTVNGSYWGATYNISFDLNWGKKKPKVSEIIQSAINESQQPPKTESTTETVVKEQE